ncbi:MAG: hypothetical protein RLZZ176_493, partial [Cyanobacteriota bacterium]
MTNVRKIVQPKPTVTTQPNHYVYLDSYHRYK